MNRTLRESHITREIFISIFYATLYSTNYLEFTSVSAAIPPSWQRLHRKWLPDVLTLTLIKRAQALLCYSSPLSSFKLCIALAAALCSIKFYHSNNKHGIAFPLGKVVIDYLNEGLWSVCLWPKEMRHRAKLMPQQGKDSCNSSIANK